MAKETTILRSSAKPQAGGGSLLRYLPAVVILCGLGFGYLMGWHHYLTLAYLAESRATLKAVVAGSPVLAPIVFMVCYTLAVAFSFPAASVLTIFAGFLFGWLLGGGLALVGATMGGSLLFLAARSAFGHLLRDRVGGAASRFADGFRENAFAYLLVLRIAPFFPFFMVNIAPALFGVRLRTFVAATAIGIVPAVFAYAWLGQGVDSVLLAAARAGHTVTVRDLVTPEITIAFSALALVAALAAVVRKVWASRAD